MIPILAKLASSFAAPSAMGPTASGASTGLGATPYQFGPTAVGSESGLGAMAPSGSTKFGDYLKRFIPQLKGGGGSLPMSGAEQAPMYQKPKIDFFNM